MEFGKPENFKAEVAKSVKAKQNIALEQAVATAKAEAVPPARVGMFGGLFV